MPKTIETIYAGGYTSKTTTPFNSEPVTVSATRFTPVDLMVSAYGSCLLGTIDFAANQILIPRLGEQKDKLYASYTIQTVSK